MASAIQVKLVPSVWQVGKRGDICCDAAALNTLSTL